ncbi:MAG: DUF882 domain-containing protein [Candidatus Binatia bacterium]|nr:DUF882 domain-containing protein [Candidatus Binatia bacterium]
MVRLPPKTSWVLLWLLLPLAVFAESGRERRAGDDRQPLRFFFAGTGQLELEHAHFSEQLRIQYRHADGSYNPQALAQLNRFFRSRGDGRMQPIPLRLVELLAYIQSRYRARPMVLLSGYRSPEFNEALGEQGRAVALASLHTQALAADITMPGIDLRKLWLRLRTEQVGGVGFYERQRFLHVDVGPPRFWEESTSRVGENLSAGNARMFARTDFDRYASLGNAQIRLHSITALPVRIAATVTVADSQSDCVVGELVALDSRIALEDHCWLIREPAERYNFELRTVDPHCSLPKRQRIRLRLVTCEPRIERTPDAVLTNPIELR